MPLWQAQRGLLVPRAALDPAASVAAPAVGLGDFPLSSAWFANMGSWVNLNEQIQFLDTDTTERVIWRTWMLGVAS